MRILLWLFLLVFYFSSVEALEINDQAISCPANMELDNTPLDLQKFKGKVVYLDFWATWCPPCMKSMPFLNDLRNELAADGFEIIAISVDDDADVARQFLKKHPVDYLIATDPTGQCPKQYGVKAMPSAYFIDRNGVIRSIHLGFREHNKQEIRTQILALLAESEEK